MTTTVRYGKVCKSKGDAIRVVELKGKNGKPFKIAEFTIAVPFKDKETGEYGDPQFYTVTTFADQVKDIVPGDRVKVEGEFVKEEFTGKDGTARTRLRLKKAKVEKQEPAPKGEKPIVVDILEDAPF